MLELVDLAAKKILLITPTLDINPWENPGESDGKGWEQITRGSLGNISFFIYLMLFINIILLHQETDLMAERSKALC